MPDEVTPVRGHCAPTWVPACGAGNVRLAGASESRRAHFDPTRRAKSAWLCGSGVPVPRNRMWWVPRWYLEKIERDRVRSAPRRPQRAPRPSPRVARRTEPPRRPPGRHAPATCNPRIADGSSPATRTALGMQSTLAQSSLFARCPLQRKDSRVRRGADFAQPCESSLP